MIPSKHFYMIRHGQTEANAARIMAGSLDSPLTELGRNQAKDVQAIVNSLEIRPSVIVHSQLSRARDTAMIINEALDIPMFEDVDIAEHFCGDWEGKPYEECMSMLSGWDTPPNGETFDEFCLRIKRCKINALTRHAGPVLFVCHGGVFRGFGRLHGLDTPGVFKNCHLYEFQPNHTATGFPWNVWDYESTDNKVSRNENYIFQNSPPIE